MLLANFPNNARNIPAGIAVGACEEVRRAEAPSRSEQQAVNATLPISLEDLASRSAVNLTEGQDERVRDTLGRYADVLSQDDLDLGRTSLVKYRINTGNRASIKSPPRPIAPARREEMQRAVNDLAKQGVIEQSDSPWLSTVILEKKKDSTQRFCVETTGP